jgi:predicted ATPase
MFLDSIRIRADALPDQYPFTVPVIQTLQELRFRTPITMLVGENGCGKSTLLEAIACGLNCPAAGHADVSRDPMLADARLLAQEMTFARTDNPRTKMFFRAEDAIGFIRRVRDSLSELESYKEEFEENLTGYGRDLAVGSIEGQKARLTERYGSNPDALSHGEWFLNLIRERIHSPGIYLLDEPETPLSPIHQLALLAIIKEVAETGAQFIVATHSPILMACPGATIYALEDISIREVAWDEVEHVAVTRAFLNDPQSYLRHL